MTGSNYDIARKLLEELGIRPEDLINPPTHPQSPTFAAYISRLIPTVPLGTLRTYRPYWARIQQEWADVRIDEPTTRELQVLVEQARARAIHRRTSRDGRSAAEHMVGALRYLYRFAAHEGLVPTDHPARHLTKPRRLPSPRGAIPLDLLARVIEVVSNTGDDPRLDTLLLRLHLETACRTGTALAIRPKDVDPDQQMIRLRGKGGTVHWQPISSTLISMIDAHRVRGSSVDEQLLRYRHGRVITRRRYDHLWDRVGRDIAWISTHQVTTHWIRHTVLGWVERNFGYAVAHAYAAHADPISAAGVTLTYVKASTYEVAVALSTMTGEPHPLAGNQVAPDVATRLPLPY
ncbi:tyrosine-type recombinase/integrase [Nocardia sp. NPDC058497]|uniref:tyrosine-type recombinase/integrase n=1 Tax=Nocardia sp. NPDC058497 TaxID=3346529 RepID=UPI0036688E00